MPGSLAAQMRSFGRFRRPPSRSAVASQPSLLPFVTLEGSEPVRLTSFGPRRGYARGFSASADTWSPSARLAAGLASRQLPGFPG